MSQPAQGNRSDRGQRTGLVTLLFTDMVGSTALKQELGDRPAAELFRRHHQVIRESLKQFPGGEEIETAGDSFLITFATPSDAVEFALLAQARLRALRPSAGSLDRMGIHVGEVVVGQDSQSRKPRDLFGIQIDTCSRVMSLAKAGQTLMTRAVFDSARQALKGEEIREVGPLEWLNHGPYLLKGLEEPVEICEVREQGQPGAGPPADSEKAQRKVSADEEPVLGWRPAVGQVIANTSWVLEKKLGEGGFGEVWLGRHRAMKERRVFKFCFRADRVRSLKREMTLFRLIKERIGDHPNIVALREVYFEAPPFYVEEDYVAGSDLRGWCEAQGGAEKVSLEVRLEIVAQVADGLQAAHDSGVIHRDIKPGNILIGGPVPKAHDGVSHSPRSITVKLSDFGIGQVVSEEALAGVTRAGFTMTLLGSESSSQTGTHLYMAPELLAGKPASTQSDIYSLGVVLYQLLVGDFGRPVTMDWAKRIADPLLREDLERCFAGDPEERFSRVDLLAKNLRSLPERREAVRKQEATIAARERAAYRRGVVRMGAAASVIVVLIATLALVARKESKRAQIEAANAAKAAAAEKQERLQAERSLYVANMNLAQTAWEQNNVERVREILRETAAYPDRGFEWYYWQRLTHLPVMTLREHSGAVTSLAFSPDGQWLVTGSLDRTARLWDLRNGNQVRTLKGHDGEISSVVFSRDGQRIVTGGKDGRATIWEAASGKSLLTLKGRSGEIWSVDYSPDGQRIVLGNNDQTATVRDATMGKELLTLRGHSNLVSSAAFSGDGRRIVTASKDATAKVWDAASGSELFTLKGHEAWVNTACFSRDGQRILTASDDGTIRVWDVANGRQELILRGHNGSVSAATFSVDGRRIASAGYDHTAKVWDAQSGRELVTIKGHGATVMTVAFSPDGQRLATGGGDWMPTADRNVRLWDIAASNESLTLRGHTDPVWFGAFSPDNRRIVTAGDDQTAKLWDTTNGQVLSTVHGGVGAIRSAAFSPDGQRIAVAGLNQLAMVWKAVGGKEPVVLQGHSATVQDVAFSPDGRRIVTASDDGTAKVWDSFSGNLLLTLKGHSSMVFTAAFSSDGQRIVTAGFDGTARVWDAFNGNELLNLSKHRTSVVSADFSPDGQRIVTASSDGTAKVWDSSNGKEQLTLSGHGNQVWWAAFSPDGKRIVTGSGDQTARVWDASSGKELLNLKGHTAPVKSAMFSPDNQRILTAGWDRTAKVWQAASPQQVATWEREENEAEDRLAASARNEKAATERDQAIRTHDPGAIKQWLVLAPIPLESHSNDAALRALDAEQIRHEADFRVHADDRVTMGGLERVWKSISLPDYLIDFNKILGTPAEWCVAYAVSYIQSDTDRTGLLIKVGSDDQAKVYLNGKEIYREELKQSCVPEQDLVAGIDLRAGVNVLVFKVVNMTGEWQGSIRFTDAAGQPVKGIRVTLDPGKAE